MEWNGMDGGIYIYLYTEYILMHGTVLGWLVGWLVRWWVGWYLFGLSIYEVVIGMCVCMRLCMMDVWTEYIQRFFFAECMQDS